MRKLRIFGVVLLALVAAWTLFGLLRWLPLIPAEQRAALARLRAEPPPLPGRDATLHAWLVAHDVPAAEWPRWLAMAEVDAQAALAKLPPPDPWPSEFAPCIGWGQGCLVHVTATAGAARTLREAYAEHLQRLEWVQRETTHVALVGPHDARTPLPPLGSLHAPVRLEVSLRFLDGDRQSALERLCGHARWWRSVRRHTDLTLTASLGAAVLAGAGDSYVELLQALPAGESPPASCASAFAPLADAELDLCRPIRNDFLLADAMLRAGLASTEDDTFMRRLARRQMYHPEATSALQAPAYDYWCSAPQRALAATRAAARMTPPGRCNVDGWSFNPVGCVLSQIAAPTLPAHYQRALDLDGRMRLVATAAWLHAQPSVTAAAFERRPAALHDSRHGFDPAPCAPALLFRARSGPDASTPWRLPLAPPADCARTPAP